MLSAMAATPRFRSLGFYAIAWIEHFLVHGPGDVQGQRIDLDDEFAEFIIRCYELDGRGARKIRRAVLSRAKGRSKSGLAAMIEAFEALGECRFDHWAAAGETSDWGYEFESGEPVGRPLAYVEALNVATEEGQAGNTYDAVYYMLNAETCSPALLARFGKLDVGLTRINLPNMRGFIEPVTSADTSKDGGKSTFIVVDESHLWVLPRLKRLHGIMTRNLLKRKVASGWMLETSTMYAEGEGSVAEGTHAYAKSSGPARRYLLFDHQQASPGWDLAVRKERLAALREAYGPAAAWMNLPAIADSWDDPQVSEAEFRRFWLNQPVPLVAPKPRIIPEAAWNDLAGPGPEDGVAPTALAIDMSPDRVITIAACWTSDGTAHVEIVAMDRVTDPAVAIEWLTKRAPAQRIPVVLFAGGASASLETALEQAGLVVVVVNSTVLGKACGHFYDEVSAGRVTHAGQQCLDDALAGAKKKDIRDAGAWVWDFTTKPPVSPLIAVTLALYGAVAHATPTEVWGFWE